MAGSWKFGDVVKPRNDRAHYSRRFMYIAPGNHPDSFKAICLVADAEDPYRLVGVGAVGHIYPDWSRLAFEKVDE